MAVVPGRRGPATGVAQIGGATVEVFTSPAMALLRADERIYDLLVLAGLDVDEQSETARQFQQRRRWRLVPVLYVLPENGKGFPVPGGYRPEVDGLVRGTLDSPAVVGRIAEMAHDGMGTAEPVVAGGLELDPLHLKLRLPNREVDLTEREAEVLAILLSHPNRMVTTSELIERGWGAGADVRHLQILRRHMSNIRRKLAGTAAANAVFTVRGAGYRFDVSSATLM